MFNLSQPKRIAENLTKDEVTSIYHAVKFASYNNKTAKQAFLAVEDKVNDDFTPRSCGRFFKCFEAMQTGSMYKQSIGENPTRWFLEIIRKEDECEGLELALNALRANIKHRQTPPNKHNMGGYIKILTDFSDCQNTQTHKH